MAFSLSLSRWILNTMVSWRSIWCNSFAVCLLGSVELWVYDQLYLFTSMKVFEFLWSLLCMISYSLVFFLRYLGFVWPTWSIYLSMGRGALWWVRSYGAWSQWQKGNRHVCIIAIKDNKMGFISYCMSLSLYIMSSCLMRYSVLMNLIL